MERSAKFYIEIGALFASLISGLFRVFLILLAFFIVLKVIESFNNNSKDNFKVNENIDTKILNDNKDFDSFISSAESKFYQLINKIDDYV